jgi:hypothetical protein
MLSTAITELISLQTYFCPSKMKEVVNFCRSRSYVKVHPYILDSHAVTTLNTCFEVILFEKVCTCPVLTWPAVWQTHAGQSKPAGRVQIILIFHIKRKIVSDRCSIPKSSFSFFLRIS